VLEGLVDGGYHVGGLGQADEVALAALHGDFGDKAVLLAGQNDLGLEVLTEDFGELAEAVFDLVTNGGSDFVLTCQVLYVH
jgi:hypothetical protein